MPYSEDKEEDAIEKSDAEQGEVKDLLKDEIKVKDGM